MFQQTTTFVRIAETAIFASATTKPRVLHGRFSGS